MAGESEKKRHHTELVSPQQTNNHDLEKRKKKDKKEKAAGEADQSGGQILKAEVICDESEDFKKKKKKRERMESSDQRNQGEVIEHITARECEKKRHNIELDSPQQTNYHVLEKKKKKDIKENAAGEEVQKQIFQVVEILKEEIIFEEIEAIEKRERKKKRKEERMDLSDQMSAEREKKRRKEDRERLDDEAPPPKSQHLTGHCKRKNAEDGKNWLEEEAERLRLEAKDAEREMCIQNLIEQARNRLKKKKKKRDKKRDKVRHHVPIASDSTLVKESVEKDKSSSRPIKLFPLFNLAKGVRQKKDSVGSVVSESHLDNDDPKRRPEVDFEFDPCQSAVVSTQIGFDQKISQQKSQNFVEAKILENFDHVVKTSHSTHADQLGKVSTNPSIKQGGMDAVDDNNCFDGNSTDFDNKELNTAFKGLNFKKPSVVKSTSSDSPSLKDQSQEDVEADVAGIGTPDVVAGTCADESYRNDPAESDKSRSVCQSSVRIDDLNLSSSSFELDQVLDGVESSVSDDKVELGFDMGDVESVVEPEFFADHGKMDLMLSTVNLPLLDIEDHKERKHAESSSPENFRPFTQLPVSPAKNLNATPVEEDSEDDVVRRAEEFGSKSKESISCSICGAKYATQQLLNNHVKYKHETQEVACEICNKKYGCRRSMLRHLKLIHERMYVTDCPECKKTFLNSSDMKRHVKSMHQTSVNEKTKVQCPECDKNFTNSTNLKRHINSIHLTEGVQTHQCDQCDKAYKHKVDLDNHHSAVHDKKEKFACQLCDTVFLAKRLLTKHIWYHHKKLDVECSVCQLKVKKTYLQNHMITNHSDVRPIFQCSVCHKCLSSKPTLRNHMKKFHEGASATAPEAKSSDAVVIDVKSDDVKTDDAKGAIQRAGRVTIFSCDDCSKVFPTAKHLKDHFRAVKHERPEGQKEKNSKQSSILSFMIKRESV